MYKTPKFEDTSIVGIEAYAGETIEMKVERITQTGEPIKDGAEMIYQDREEGVQPSYDIRTDKWDIAIDAMDNSAEAKRRKRQELLEKKSKKDEPKEEKEKGKADGEEASSQSTQTTSEGQS